MRWTIAALMLGIQACGDDADEPSSSRDDRAERICREYFEGLCSQFVRCRVLQSNGAVYTQAACDAVLPSAIASCVDDSTDDIAMTPDEAADACTNAIRNQACDLVCNRIPEDPPECLALDAYQPNTEARTCSP